MKIIENDNTLKMLPRSGYIHDLINIRENTTSHPRVRCIMGNWYSWTHDTKTYHSSLIINHHLFLTSFGLFGNLEYCASMFTWWGNNQVHLQPFNLCPGRTSDLATIAIQSSISLYTMISPHAESAQNNWNILISQYLITEIVVSIKSYFFPNPDSLS